MDTIYRQRASQTGLTLVELMIAMAIGLVLIGGALFVYSNARAAYTTNESFALMQENARFALSILEPDLELAGYWGQHRDATVIIGSALDREATGQGPVAVGNDCDANWVLQFDRYVEGFNDVEATWNTWDCIPDGRIQAGSDLFAVRRVSEIPATVLNDGQVYLRSSEAPLAEVFIGNNEPSSLPDSAANYEVVANAYYVSPTSIGADTNNDALPSLRRVQLIESGGVPTMLDTEVTTGIEDMQVQYGVGPESVGGTRSAVQLYVNDINNLTPPNTAVRSMRIWLLMRTERPETGYTDDKTYQLGDKIIPPRDDGYRRIVVSKTIYFRNQH